MAIYDGVSRKIFLDRELIGQDQPHSSLNVTRTDNFAVGNTNDPHGSTQHFHGKMRNIKVWGPRMKMTNVLTIESAWYGRNNGKPGKDVTAIVRGQIERCVDADELHINEHKEQSILNNLFITWWDSAMAKDST
jgi:hypothetical protein